MSVAAVARRYAKALFDVAQSAGSLDAARHEVAGVAHAWRNTPEFRSALENPALGTEALRTLVTSLAAKLKLSEPVTRIFALLAERRRLAALPDLSAQFDRLIESRAGLVRADVTTVKKLDAASYAALQAALEQSSGKKVEIVAHEDPSILGGVITKMGDTVFDGSVRNRLRDLEEKVLRGIRA